MRLGVAYALVSVLGFDVAVGIILFAAAGRFDLPMFWAYLAALLVLCLLASIVIFLRSPDLVKERMHPGKGERDPLTVRAMLVLCTAQYAIAGVDVGRYRWTGAVPLGLQVVALLGVIAGLAFAFWATAVNRFFSSAVRIQADRGQQVITSGPYRFIRHPGYTGALVYLLCGSVALGSWWSLAPMLVMTALMIRRTMIEDRMLQHDLAGYSEYVRNVRYRLVPGVW
ncbi:MAG TPA: isoprenylcysteine carboxylmethyltransferase family protein [bacterium]|nr:isoprenylcysteine carboxylmethyltransferase family protein [bacterium]